MVGDAHPTCSAVLNIGRIPYWMLDVQRSMFGVHRPCVYQVGTPANRICHLDFDICHLHFYSADLQQHVDSELQMNPSKEDILQSHSLKFLEAALRTDRQQPMRQADGHGRKSRGCGDTVGFFLSVQEDRIRAITYEINGCINTNACANAVIDLLEGQPLSKAWGLKPGDVADYLESLPAHEFHCAELAVGALCLALADARENQRSPWKKLYR
jgi:nitrogen fixation protein NifU and related proteins